MACNPSRGDYFPQKAEAAEFEPSLACRVSSRTGKALQAYTFSKKKKMGEGMLFLPLTLAVSQKSSVLRGTKKMDSLAWLFWISPMLFYGILHSCEGPLEMFQGC